MTAWQRASDAELISAVRDDDPAAWAELCHRHLEAARRLARTLVSAKAADELVARVAERVLDDLRRGEGPDVAFRPYLLARVGDEQRPSVVPVHGAQPPGSPEAGDTRPAARAFRALPERWQLVLWHVDVERDDPGQVAPLLGAAARSVPAAARRARAGLGAATLELHAQEADDPHPDCGWTREHLLAHVRGAATRRESGKVSAHVQGCTPCRSVHTELAAADDDLAGILGPLVLGTAAAGYLTPRRAGPVARHPVGAALAGMAAAVALITGVAIGLHDPANDPPEAEAPVLGSPSATLPSTDSGVTLAPSASGEPDAESPSTRPGGPATAPSSAPPPTTTSPSPSPPPGSPSDDPTTASPEPDISVPPTSAPPPTTPPPPGADPAVTALPTSAGSVSTILVAVKDVAETDGELIITAKGSGVEFFVDGRCTPMEGAKATCDLSEDASAIKLIADRREADGDTVVTFGITPKPGVDENPDNNHYLVTLPPPPNEG